MHLAYQQQLEKEQEAIDDKGQITQIDYGVGSPQIKVTKWGQFCQAITTEKSSPTIQTFKKTFKPEEFESLTKLAAAYLEKSASKDEKVIKESRDLLDKQQPSLSAPAKRLIEPALQRL